MVKHSSKFGELTKEHKIGVLILLITVLTLIIIAGIVFVPKLLAKPAIKDIPEKQLTNVILDVIKTSPTQNTIIPTNLQVNPKPPPQPNPINPSQLPSPTVSSLPLAGTVICGINQFSDIWCADTNIIGTGSPNWRQIPGRLSSLVVNNDGSIYGANEGDSSIWYCSSYKIPQWVRVPGGLRQVSYNGTQLCGVNTYGEIWYATDGIKGIGSPNWAMTNGGRNGRQILANSNGSVYLNTTNYQIWYAPEIKAKDENGNPSLQWVQIPSRSSTYIGANNTTLMSVQDNGLLYATKNIDGTGTPNWVSIPLPLQNVIITSLNLNSDGTMYITFSNGSIWYGTSTYTNPGWKQIPGGLKYISSNK